MKAFKVGSHYIVQERLMLVERKGSKALDITFENGGQIDVEGTEAEINKFLEAFQGKKKRKKK